MQNNKKVLLILLGIIFLAFSFRCWGISGIFISSDEANITLAALDVFHVFDNLSFGNIGVHVLRLYAFPWGYVTPLISFLNLSILSLFSIPLTEFFIRLPFVLLGTISCLLVFLIGKQVYSEKTGLIAALLFAVLPVHIEYSKVISSNIITSSFFLMSTVYFFINYLNNENKKNAAMFSLSLGVYLGSDNQFLMIFFVLFGIGFILSTNICIRKRIVFALKSLLQWRIFIFSFIIFSPLLISWLYFICKGQYNFGFIGHIFDKQKSLGIHPEVLVYTIRNCGLVITVLLAISIFVGFGRFLKLKKDSLLFLWAVVYLCIWLFVAKPMIHAQGNRAYYILWIIPLLIIGASLLANIKKDWLFFLSVSVIIVSSFWHNYMQPTMMEEAFTSNINNTARYTNYGIKTAGYYIRENSKPDDLIFSDMGLVVTRYYTHRKVVSNPLYFWTISSSPDSDKYEYLVKNKYMAKLVLVRFKNKDLAEKALGAEFRLTAAVYSNDKLELLIYSRNNRTLERLDSEKFDKMFDRKFGKIKDLYLDKYFLPEEL